MYWCLPVRLHRVRKCTCARARGLRAVPAQRWRHTHSNQPRISLIYSLSVCVYHVPKSIRLRKRSCTGSECCRGCERSCSGCKGARELRRHASLFRFLRLTTSALISVLPSQLLIGEDKSPIDVHATPDNTKLITVDNVEEVMLLRLITL